MGKTLKNYFPIDLIGKRFIDIATYPLSKSEYRVLGIEGQREPKLPKKRYKYSESKITKILLFVEYKCNKKGKTKTGYTDLNIHLNDELIEEEKPNQLKIFDKLIED